MNKGKGKCIKKIKLLFQEKNFIKTLVNNSFNNILEYMDVKSICYFVQLSSDNLSLMSESHRMNIPIIPLQSLPINSNIFEGILRFKIIHTGELNDLPRKINKTHCIHYNLNKIGEKKHRKKIEMLKDIYSITIFSRIRYFNIFSNIKDIDLSYVYPKNTNHNINLSCLRNVYKLNLKNWPLADVNQFKNVKILNVSNNCLVRNVEELGNVYDLRLKNCRFLSDVSKLGKKNKKLDLSNNYNIVNVRSLGKVEYLNLSGCRYIKNVDTLGNVHELILDGCMGVRDISKLQNNYKLSINFLNITDITNQFSINTLNLSGCRNIVKIEYLKKKVCKLKKLDLSECTYITDFQNLHFLDEVILDYCNQINDVSPFRNIKKVSLKYCKLIKDVTPLENANEVNLTGCSLLKNIDNLCNVSIINITWCTGISDISCLINVKKIIIENCYIQDVNLGLLKLCNPDIEILYYNNFF